VCTPHSPHFHRRDWPRCRLRKMHHSKITPLCQSSLKKSTLHIIIFHDAASGNTQIPVSFEPMASWIKNEKTEYLNKVVPEQLSTAPDCTLYSVTANCKRACMYLAVACYFLATRPNAWRALAEDINFLMIVRAVIFQGAPDSDKIFPSEKSIV
jgi:hypothetical protein